MSQNKVQIEVDVKKSGDGVKQVQADLSGLDAALGRVGAAATLLASEMKALRNDIGAAFGGLRATVQGLAEEVTRAGAALKSGVADQAAFSESARKAAETDRAAAAAAQERNRTMAEGRAVYEATRTAAERFEAELARLKGLLDANAVSQDTHGRAVKKLTGDYQASLPATKEMQRQQAEGKALFEATRTPAERFRTELTRLKSLHESGAISQDTYKRGLAAAQAEFGRTRQASLGLRGELTSLGSGVGNLIRTFVGLAGAYLGLRALKSIVGEGLKAVDDYRLATIGVAATLTDSVEGTQDDIKAAYTANANYARETFDKVELAAAKYFASGKELVGAWQILTQKRVLITSDADIDNLGIIVDRIKLATAGQVAEMQIAQELRAVMNGQARATDQIAMLLKDRLGPEWEKQLDLARQEGRVLEFLADQFRGLRAASEDVSNTLKSQGSTLGTMLIQIGREGLSGVYADSVGLLKILNDYLSKHKDELIALIRDGYGELRKKIPEYSRDAIEAFKKIRDTVSSIYDWVKSNSEMAEFGLIGYMLLGKRGLVLGAIIGDFERRLKELRAEYGIAEPGAQKPPTAPSTGQPSDYTYIRRHMPKPGEVDMGFGMPPVPAKSAQTQAQAQADGVSEALKQVQSLFSNPLQGSDQTRGTLPITGPLRPSKDDRDLKKEAKAAEEIVKARIELLKSESALRLAAIEKESNAAEEAYKAQKISALDYYTEQRRLANESAAERIRELEREKVLQSDILQAALVDPEANRGKLEIHHQARIQELDAEIQKQEIEQRKSLQVIDAELKKLQDEAAKKSQERLDTEVKLLQDLTSQEFMTAGERRQINERYLEARIRQINQEAAELRKKGADAVLVEKWVAGEIRKEQESLRSYSLAQLQAILRDQTTTAERREQIWRQIQDRIKAGEASSWDAFQMGWENTIDHFNGLSQDMLDISSATATGMRDGFKTLFTSGLKGDFAGVVDWFDSFLNKMLDMWMEALANMVMQGLGIKSLFNSIGSLFGTAVTPAGAQGGGAAVSQPVGQITAVAHTGLVVEQQSPSTFRIVPASAFSSAPRLHLGIDEVPAILQAGEEVVSRDDRKTIRSMLEGAQGGAQPVTVNLVNNTGTQATARKGSDGPRWDGKKWVQDIVLEAVNGGNESLMYAIANLK